MSTFHAACLVLKTITRARVGVRVPRTEQETRLLLVWLLESIPEPGPRTQPSLAGLSRAPALCQALGWRQTRDRVTAKPGSNVPRGHRVRVPRAVWGIAAMPRITPC